jgi:leader peptidase (prepilin peptidase)/N-methyltransferase
MLIYAFCFILGAIIGSFLNAVIYRLPKKNLKLWDPPFSVCPVCGHRLAWKDNIPIVSYIFLKGRCRYCGAKIPIRYLLVEILTAVAFTVSPFLSKDPLVMISLCGIFATLIAISFMDLEVMGIHDSLNISLLAFSFLFAWRNGSVYIGIITALIGAGLFLVLALVKKGIGMGDVFMMGAGGVALDFISLDVALLIAAFGGLIYAVLKCKKLNMKQPIPFGPFLALGIATGILIRIFL